MSHFENLNHKELTALGELFNLFEESLDLSTIEWAETRRHLSKEESHYHGRFDCDKIPALEYIYECLDNWLIPIIVCMKASQVGWSELNNNFIGKTMEINPTKMQLVFPNASASKVYSREKLKTFFNNCQVLSDLLEIGRKKSRTKESFNYFEFPGGFLKLTTAGSISNAKSSSINFIQIEEPDDVKDDVANQGDTLENYKRRQVTIPIGHKKLIYGGTPTDKDFSRVAKGYDLSNRLVFKACCHICNELSVLSSDNIVYAEYDNLYIHEHYGKDNPETAYYQCPNCKGAWSDLDRENNIREGKKYGFTDHTGVFSKGWHPNRPEEIEIFGFHIPELISTLSQSSHIDIAKKKILAIRDKEKGNEGKIKSFLNNVDGLPFASGLTSMEVEDMVKLRKNYPENICPMEGLILTAGIDVQDNRIALVVRAWGRKDNSWLVLWKEIHGNVVQQEWDEYGLRYTGVWGELADLLIENPFIHASGKDIYVSAISIDSGDNTENVYNWVNWANAKLDSLGRNASVFATKGVRELKSSQDPIYQEPSMLDINSNTRARKLLYQTKGITLFILGAHKAHDEILLRIHRNTLPDCHSGIYYFSKQSYGQYEEQMLSCRKLQDGASAYKTVFKLIPGRRKEAMDAEKNALHAQKASGIHLFGNDHWRELEKYYYN